MLKSCTPPDALNKRRVQFQTIDEQTSLDRVTGIISRSLANVVQEQVSGKYKPKAANRPAEPRANAQQIEETFRLAEEAAAQQNDSLAEKLFQQVILKDPQGWGEKALEQLVSLRSHRTALPISVMRSASSKDNPRPRRESSRSRVYDILPSPFEWIEIPGGIGKTWKDVPFAIAKYPTTNAQFAKFIEAKGYDQKQWWTEAGWRVREEKKWTQPSYWMDAKWNGSDQPVVGVSWYEAVAFCLWLTGAAGEKIMLPTQDQWQYAAQGDDSRDFPWGKDWDASRCNNNVDQKGIGKTIPVRQYEGKGDSFFGVVDMAGNVWEWCLTDTENNTNELNSNGNYRVLRGGAWDDNGADTFRCESRLRDFPVFRLNDYSFRFARSLSTAKHLPLDTKAIQLRGKQAHSRG